MINYTKAIPNIWSLLPSVVRAGLSAAIISFVFIALFPSSHEAKAVASFARQTGQPCGACHTDFPALTPFGRRFKLGGYTLGGGDKSDAYKKTFGNLPWVAPISMMAVAGFTQQKSLGADNHNLDGQTWSLFYGGAITEKIGAFVQVTYDSPGEMHWDNLDVRYASTGQIGGMDVTYGVTLHNNPTVQDVWNTVPAWGFPFMTSSKAATPAASTAIDGRFEMQVLGLGAYAFIADMFYIEATGYKTLNPGALHHLGVSALDSPGSLNNVSPYVRVAFEPHWGNHYLMVGAFGMQTKVNPWKDPEGTLGFATFSPKDIYTDLGVDAQYQYLADGNAYALTLRGIYINERQKLDASTVPFGTNPTNTLNTFRGQASFAYGANQKVILTGGYFNTWGTADAVYYPDSLSGKPDSNGWIAEIAFYPFGMNTSPVWPYFNARVGLQYTWYNKFNGMTGSDATDNNTLYAYVWVAM
jgi:hypothetical protein